MASWFSILEALAASNTTVSLSMSLANTCNHQQYHTTFYVLWSSWKTWQKSQTSMRFLSTVKLVKCESTSLITTISSMAVILLVMAPCCDKRWYPIAIVTDKTVDMAIGIPPMRSTKKVLIPSLKFLCWIGYMTTISIIMPVAIEHIQKLPMAVNTYQ